MCVHDVVEEEGVPYIVMEFVEGVSLAERIAVRGPVDAREAARIGLALLSALRAAHAIGVLHRDLKPANVLIEEATGRVVLSDFGIARLAGATTLTEDGMFVGSPEYTAPERVQGRQAGPASDLWSLGVLLCAVMTGRSPFHRDSLGGVLHAVMEAEIRPPAATGPLLPVVRGLLERDPERRIDAAEAERLLYASLAAAPPPGTGRGARASGGPGPRVRGGPAGPAPGGFGRPGVPGAPASGGFGAPGAPGARPPTPSAVPPPPAWPPDMAVPPPPTRRPDAAPPPGTGPVSDTPTHDRPDGRPGDAGDTRQGARSHESSPAGSEGPGGAVPGASVGPDGSGAAGGSGAPGDSGDSGDSGGAEGPGGSDAAGPWGPGGTRGGSWSAGDAEPFASGRGAPGGAEPTRDRPGRRGTGVRG
ncbi:protein kinase, partial [Streptomyces sp. CC53]|uniref:protein kinase domain-containing protein n=2 Tax=unclassified Streptomyces TaxID=2593676 RepID=UPI003528D29B